MSKISFSFCIYGTRLIYYEGLLRNLELISKIEPPPQVIISYDNTTMLEEYKQRCAAHDFVKLVPMPSDFLEYKMCTRLTNLDQLPRNTYAFCRDLDSRITKRDLWCIEEFMKSGCKLHAIRDHYYHKQKIMGGMCGFYLDDSAPNFTELLNNFIIAGPALRKDYGFDEAFLTNIIYPHYATASIKIHSNCIGHLGEVVSPITIDHEDNSDFIGNVYNIDATPQFMYSPYITVGHLKWLEERQQYDLILRNKKYISINTQPWEQRQDMYRLFLNASLKTNNLSAALGLIDEFDSLLVDDSLINYTNNILDLARVNGYKIIGTSDLSREPAADEIILYYGQYPHTSECLPSNTRKIYRHPIYFKHVQHTRVEYNSCWEPVSTIYILNLEERADRYYNILVELCRVHAPLDRVYHYKAQKTTYTGNKQQDIYIGASNNHLEVTQHFIKSGNETCLVLEDDITFISDVSAVWKSIVTFLATPSPYDICFIAYSKCGEIKKHNDLLSLSYQACTTSSAYFLNREGVPLIEECLQIGVDKMKEGETPNIYCCDRYWARLQSRNQMFVFKKKLAFQTITHSSIIDKINYAFD